MTYVTTKRYAIGYGEWHWADPIILKLLQTPAFKPALTAIRAPIGELQDAGGTLSTGQLVVMFNEKETLHCVGPVPRPTYPIAGPVAQCCGNG
ncbi:unnamed protein product [Boreogadus saida]